MEYKGLYDLDPKQYPDDSTCNNRVTSVDPNIKYEGVANKYPEHTVQINYISNIDFKEYDLNPKEYNIPQGSCGSKQQLESSLLNRSNKPKYDNIDDLNHKLYNAYQMYRFLLNRGDNPEYGNVDDLDLKEYNDYQVFCISLGRGTDVKFGNVDDLSPKQYTEDQMYNISVKRGNGPVQ